ncbi:hypothetical protein [Microbacterium sp. C7(2022)]|uniref:hypothetical protein n=1 Tax=Microbacterium sp. C7(2022) TaxID=2992759 RepID=UPI00237A3078|nr:hypothetical protein [Microbacterium sp. C7(2022)]MDE0547420.1 hypothetical protein [Microbacterium sp. C7(2022)]
MLTVLREAVPDRLLICRQVYKPFGREPSSLNLAITAPADGGVFVEQIKSPLAAELLGVSAVEFSTAQRNGMPRGGTVEQATAVNPAGGIHVASLARRGGGGSRTRDQSSRELKSAPGTQVDGRSDAVAHEIGRANGLTDT